MLKPETASAGVPGLAGDARGRPGFFARIKPGNRSGCASPRSDWILCLLAVGLAGCATGPRGDGTRAPDWESVDMVAAPVTPPVPPPPAPAPAPLAPAAPTNAPTETWIPLSRWCAANGLAALRLTGQAPTFTCALSTTGGVFVVRTGSQVAHWDGLEIRLGFAPQMMNGQPCIHALDAKKTLEPLAGGSCLSFPGTDPTIVIDAGHGGGDSGTWSVLDNRHEKEFTLDWARRLGALLATNGWRVFLTRTSDTSLSISNRIAFAAARQADVFLSLHFNSSAPNDQQAGLETYCLTPIGMPSSVTRGYGDDTELAYPNNAFDTQNLRFALRVHRALLQVNGRHDRGVRRARFLGVLRGQRCPAILVEGGYLSNPPEARQIADPAYRQKLAEAVAQALGEKTEGASQASGASSQRAEIRTQNPAVPSTNLLQP